jgi:hypothetical protein
MDSDGQTHHVRQNHGPARPGLYRALAVRRHCLIDLVGQMMIDERTFLD